MKFQASVLLVLAAGARLIEAGWDPASDTLSYDALCGGHPSETVSHVCFTSSRDVTHITTNTNFHGFYSADRHNFVMYQAAGELTAMYGSLNNIVNVNYDVNVNGQTCAAYDVQDVNGNGIRNGIYCPGQAAVSLE